MSWIKKVSGGKKEPEKINEHSNLSEAEKTVGILLVRGESLDGDATFAYVAVRMDRIEEFMEAQKQGIFYPEDYGVIIESGVGEPSEEIRKKMEEDYGFDHEGMISMD